MKKTLTLLSSFVCLFLLEGLKAQNVYVRTNSTQTSYSLSNIRKLTFSSGNIEVNPISGTADSYALNTMRYLNFTD